MPKLNRKIVLILAKIYIFKFVGTKDNTKRCNLREKISKYMDRAENIKQHLEQEKEGKEAVLENTSVNDYDRPFTQCSWLLPFGALCGLDQLSLGAYRI